MSVARSAGAAPAIGEPVRVAFERADAAFEERLRARYLGHDGVAVAGRKYRAYAHMRVGEAVKFYAAIGRRWDAATLASDLASVGLADAFEIRRLKRAYQRALVLALAMASRPRHLVIEGAEEFDDERTSALLARSLARVESATVTYAGRVTHADAGLAVRPA